MKLYVLLGFLGLAACGVAAIDKQESSVTAKIAKSSSSTYTCQKLLTKGSDPMSWSPAYNWVIKVAIGSNGEASIGLEMARVDGKYPALGKEENVAFKIYGTNRYLVPNAKHGIANSNSLKAIDAIVFDTDLARLSVINKSKNENATYQCQ